MNRWRIIDIALGFAIGAICVAFLLLAGAARATPAADPPPQEQEAVALQAGAPALVGYQGRLANPTTGDPLSGTYAAIFRIFAAATGGSPCWYESKTITVTNGDFSTYLGSANPTGLVSCLGGGTARWLEIVISGEVLSPRLRLASAPYAIQAEEAKNADTVDGQHASAFVLRSGDTMSGPLVLTATTIPSYLVTAINGNSAGSGVYGEGYYGVRSKGRAYGVYGEGGSYGVYGSGSMYGVHGSGYYGVFGSGYYGVRGESGYAAVSGHGRTTGYAGRFENRATITPSLWVQNAGGGDIIAAYGTSGLDVEFKVTGAGDVYADGQFVSDVAPGTPPLVVTSTTRVDNLNADLVDGKNASDFAAAAHTHTVADIADEPGIAFVNRPMRMDLDSINWVEVTHVTITVPGPGYVLVQAAGWIAWPNYTGGRTVEVGIGPTPDGPSCCFQFEFGLPSGQPLGPYRAPLAVSRVYEVTSAGSYTYYLHACVDPPTGGVDKPHIYPSSFQALYFPSAYGTTALSTGATVTKAP